MGNKLGSFYAAEQITLSYFYITVKSNATVDFYAMPMLVAGDVPSPAYAPYTGTTATLTLPETIYGGTVDAVTGMGEKTATDVVVDGETIKFSELNTNWNLPNNSSPGVASGPESIIKTSAFPNSLFSTNARFNFIFTRARQMAPYFSTVEELNAFCAAQYATGTPVTIAYKLATPEPFQATGGQSLPALPGTNTIYTDAGAVTVSGLSDTVETFNALENRIAALEEAAISG